MSPSSPSPRLVLASTSRYRRALLDRLGVPYVAVAPDCDEDAWKDRGLAPVALAVALARAKAASVVALDPARYGGCHVLGSDQLVDLDGVVLGKPGTVDAAIAQLERMAGREHRLVTAVALQAPDGSVRELVDVHRLRMRALDRAALARYVARDAPLDCAGAYKIEEGGIALFASIVGDDFTAIVGLPLLGVGRLLADAGFPFP
jgi:septum formation protein